MLLGAFVLSCSSDRSGFEQPRGQSFAPADAGADGDAPHCAATTRTAVPVPLDVIFLLDRSGSMQGPKWDAVSTAIPAFANQGFPAPTQIGLSFVPFIVNESFFGDQKGTNYQVCEYRLYKELVLPLAPATAQRATLEAAIAGAIVPGSSGFGSQSPLHASLRGTYFAAAKAQDAHPDHQVVVVMMGDGDPTYCEDYGAESTSPNALAALAASALHYNGVRTFAVGFQSTTLGVLEKLTAAGGGKVLIPVSYTTGNLLEQMNLLTRSAIDCVFALPKPPAGQKLDPKTVRLDVTARTGERTAIPRAADATSCHGEDGWYYDNDSKPTKAILCPTSCTGLRSQSGARVDIAVACNGGVQ
jgi:hypothetical protein